PRARATAGSRRSGENLTMDAYRISIKFFLTGPIDLEKAVHIFHRWIQEQSLSGHLLIDVARYEHVSEGPKIVLVSHEANISLDDTGGQWGLIYQRKRPIDGTFDERLARILAAAIEACSKLELEPELAAKFNTDKLELKILDKLAAPNEPGTYEKAEPAVGDVLEKIWGKVAKIDRRVDAVQPFALSVRFASAPGMMDLIERSAVAAT
ncbi:MAG TPA: hypothetical protein VG722_07035, partial [Tepidisphaeraceae bacterium]|nr:hypothetical protein [Tepidisphaeraceae bacterium]